MITTQQHAAIAAIIILSGMMPSCMMPDPMFSENVGMIQDINYPPSKIVGTWASFDNSPLQPDELKTENKTYYEIYPKGRGKTVQSSKSLATGNSIAMEANFKWEYLGANTWKIKLPPSSEYRITDSRSMTMGSIGARECQVRYYEGNLYQMKGGQVWVPATARNISELAKRRREQDPIIQMNLQ